MSKKIEEKNRNITEALWSIVCVFHALSESE